MKQARQNPIETSNESSNEKTESMVGGDKRYKLATRLLGYCLLSGFSLVVSLFLAEFLARSYLVSPLIILPRYAESLVPIGNSDLIDICDQKATGLPYVLKPGLKTIFKLVDFQTNSFGMRDREFLMKKPVGIYRVVVLGDSFTLPEGVELESSWHKLLEKELNSRNNLYEFMNFGVGGYRFDEYVSTLSQNGLRFNPDHVLIGICPFNDLPMKWQKPRPERFIIRKCPSMFNKLYLKDLLNQAVPSLEPPFADEVDRDMPISEKWSIENCNFDSIRNSLKELKEMQASNSFKLSFVVLRRGNEAEFQTRIFKDLAEEFGIDFVDTGPSFSDSGRQWWLFPMDGHPNAKANRIFAETIKKAIRFDR